LQRLHGQRAVLDVQVPYDEPYYMSLVILPGLNFALLAILSNITGYIGIETAAAFVFSCVLVLWGPNYYE
jgi:hypothetical protein